MPMFNYNNIDNIQICMDVPFVDHPYLIGPRGRKCQHLMDRHRSLIHFPDSNRRQNGPKLNNVIINGSSKNAEELRFQIRSRTPIRLALFLQNFPDVNVLCSRMECAIAERSLPIRLNYTENYSNAMLKTEWRNEDTLVAFCNEFFHSDESGKGEDPDLFTMALTILPVVNPWNQELSHYLIEHIFHVTGARVFYPPKEKFADQPPSYFIKGGTAFGVLKAGKYMMGLTMFQVSFVVPSSVQMNLSSTEEWQKELLVHTTIEPVFANNTKSGNSSELLHNRAVLRSFEFCLNSVYFVRSLLLGFKKTVQSSHYDFMIDVKRMIPYSVFSEGQLYFPLYTIDDEHSFDFDTSGTEFFQRFYGGPYSLERHEKQRKLVHSTPVLQSVPVPIASLQCSQEQALAALYGSPTPPQLINNFKEMLNGYDTPMAPPPQAAPMPPWNSGFPSYCYSDESGYSFYNNSYISDHNNNSGSFFGVVNGCYPDKDYSFSDGMAHDTSLMTMMTPIAGKLPEQAFSAMYGGQTPPQFISTSKEMMNGFDATIPPPLPPPTAAAVPTWNAGFPSYYYDENSGYSFYTANSSYLDNNNNNVGYCGVMNELPQKAYDTGDNVLCDSVLMPGIALNNVVKTSAVSTTSKRKSASF